ncbi:MAG: hypothetical protein Q4F66_09230 [Clostridium sp.]|nr:hypothetical protein [Clostridium sp.]
MKKLKQITSVFFIAALLMISGCNSDKDKGNDLVFNKSKTTGTVNTVSNDKLTLTVTEDNAHFKAGDNVVVTYQNLYLDSKDKTSDVLQKIDTVAVGDTVYVTYSEEERKDTIINVEYAVKHIN